MITTLKSLRAKVKKYPERYGRGNFFKGGKPYCPIAVEIAPDLYMDDDNYVEEVAKRLGCTSKKVWDFIGWWDDCKLDLYLGISK